MQKTWILAAALWLLAACGGPAVPAAVSEPGGAAPTAAVAATVPPTSTPAPPPAVETVPPTAPSPPTATTVSVEPSPTAEPPAAVTAALVGRTEDGALFRGRADAPVTIIDYSDFL